MKEEKTCRGCGDTLILNKDNFYSNGFTPKGTKKWKPTCKGCESSERKDHTMSIIYSAIGTTKPKCQICDYNRDFTALEFHHVDPSIKEHKISSFMSSRRNEAVIRAEIAKCLLVCANCHREIHSGLVRVTEEDLQFTE